MMKTKKVQRILKKIRQAEEKLASADPVATAKLTTKIVRWKSTVFDES